jgi:hypothetical protein
MNASERQQTLFDIYAPDLSRLPDQAPIPLSEMMASADHMKQKAICDDLESLLARWISKELLRNSVVHALMWEYAQCMPEARREAFVNSLRELVPHFVHTRDGARTAIWLVTHGTAKDRKLMLKALKPFAVATALDEFGCMVLVRLLDVTDDTKTCAGSLLKPLLEPEALASVVGSASGCLVLLHVLSPADPKYFTQAQREMLAPVSLTSKKDPTVRRNELLAILLEPLVDLLVLAAQEVIGADYGEERPMNSKYCSNIIYECACTAGVDELAERLLDALTQLALRYTDALDFFHTSRLFKRLLFTCTSASRAPQQRFASHLWKELSALGSAVVLEMIGRKGAGFVVVAFLENELVGEEVKKYLQPLARQIAEISTPAASIIMKKIK